MSEGGPEDFLEEKEIGDFSVSWVKDHPDSVTFFHHHPEVKIKNSEDIDGAYLTCEPKDGDLKEVYCRHCNAKVPAGLLSIGYTRRMAKAQSGG